jgi:hypothetical protein
MSELLTQGAGNEAIGVGDSSPAFIIAGGDLGRVEAEEFREAEACLGKKASFDEVMERVRLNRLNELFPIEVGKWELNLDVEDGQVDLFFDSCRLGEVGNVLEKPKTSKQLRKVAAELTELADMAEGAGF